MPKLPDHDVPAGYIRGGDGQLYRKRIVAGVTAIAISGSNDPGGPERAERVEAAMAAAINKAISEGVAPDDPEIRNRMIAARDAIMSE